MEKDDQKIHKFNELEREHSGDEVMIDFTKAVWLTSRANYSAQRNMLAESIADFTEAIELKKDHLPAYLGMALAITVKEGCDFNEGEKVIEKAPNEMKMGGKVIITKKDILEQFKEMIGKI